MVEEQQLPSKSTLGRDKEASSKSLKHIELSIIVEVGTAKWKWINLAGNALELGIKPLVEMHHADQWGKNSHLQTHGTWNYTVHA